MDISGKWQGTIVYGEGYTDLKNKELFFEMEIHQEGIKITGVARDIGGHGMNDSEAYIKGIFLANRIDFIKRYEDYTLNDINQTKLQDIDVIPCVFYTGNFNSELNLISGSWEYKPKFIKFSSGENINFPGSSGTFTMTRQ